MNEPELPQSAERFTQLSAVREAEYSNPAYTRAVRILKLVLPLIALGIVTLVLAWPKMDQVKTATEQAAKPQTGSNELIHPRFEGEDEKHEPYVVNAKSAVQSTGDPDIVLMDQPRGHMTLTGGMILDGEGTKGTYHQKAQLLLLEGDVKLRNSQGYHGTTDRLQVDLQAHKAATDTPVSGDGPDASIQASGLQGDSETGTLIFTGPAHLTLKNVKAFQ